MDFDTALANLDLEQSEVYEFQFKTGGTSIGFKIRKIGKRNKFMFLPPNSATRLEGEVVAYRLGQAVGVGELFNPSGYYVLGPQAISRFKVMLREERNRHRRENTEAIRDAIARNPNSMLGIIKFRSKRDSQSVDALIKRNRFNTASTMARFLSGNGPQPGMELIGLPDVHPEKPHHPPPRATQVSLAEQLSTIFVFDMLLGQWDRFSGGNIEAYAYKDGSLRFIGRDNGGSNLLWGDNWYKKYTKWVTRFDRSLVDRLKELNAFLSGGLPQFGSFGSPEEFQNKLGFESDQTFHQFQRKLRKLLEEHVPDAEQRHGENAYFLNQS